MTKEVALVTGGTSGIGRAQVYRWVKEGFDVVFCGRNDERGHQVASETKAHYIKCDVSDVDQVQKMFLEIKDRFNRLDVIFNNAGIAPSGPCRLIDIPDDRYQELLGTNVNGMWYVLKYGIKLMIDSGNGGRIVNNGSLTGITAASALIGASDYGMNKSAITGMTMAAAIEYVKENIRVNTIAAAAIETDMIKAYFNLDCPQEQKDEMVEVLKRTNPMMKGIENMPQYSDVTGVVSFLVGPDSKFINGITIPIDGGYSIM